MLRSGDEHMDRNSELRKLQLCLTDMLLVFDEICRQEKLTYFLFGGSLLGAVRHQGFIPWDSDVDVAMPRADFERFRREASKKLPSHLELQAPETDPYFTALLIRIRNMNTICDIDNKRGSRYVGAFIDIFPLDDASKEKSLKNNLQAKLVKGILKTLADRAGMNERESKTIKQKCGDMFARVLSREQWVRLKEFIAQRQSNQSAEYFINLASHYDYHKQIFTKDKLLPPVEVLFEGHDFFAPKDYHYVLHKFYGENYMQVPNPEDIDPEEHLIKELKIGDA